MNSPTTKQVKRVPNPTGKGGFGENPENRSDGRWDKEGSISYQYHKIIRLSADELENFKAETVAQDIAYRRVLASRESLLDVKEITDRTEGKSPQAIDVTTLGEKITNIAMVEFVDADKKDTSTDS